MNLSLIRTVTLAMLIVASSIVNASETSPPPSETTNSTTNKSRDKGKPNGNAEVDQMRAMLREELAKVLQMAADDSGTGYYPVDATSPIWENSGVWVAAGQRVTVEANPKDRWDIGWGPTDATGYSYPHDPNSGTPIYHTGARNKDWHYGALLCAVGADRVEIDSADHQIEIGLKKSFAVDSAGYVYFMCNDCREGKAFTDNSGIVHVRVTVTDAKVEKLGEPQSKPAAPPETDKGNAPN